jgi:N,N'-diacetyllegionaminate synthase
MTKMDKLCFSDNRCLIIGEVAQAHDGSLGMAHAYIDAIADAGADAVKFQTHLAEAESTLLEPWRIKFSLQDDTRYEYWKRMEFTEKQWIGLKQHAEDKGLIFLSSPFSIEAVELLVRVGVSAWKIASGEAGSLFMFDRIISTGNPILLSTGMSPLAEIDAAVERIKSHGVDYILLQCTSAYPCPPEKIGLNLLNFFRERYGCPVGLSDHSGTIYPGLAAVVLGAKAIEVHVTLSREMFGPDVSASVTTQELRQLVEGVRLIECLLENPVNKDDMATELSSVRNLFTKSIVTRVDLSAGVRLSDEFLAFKKPGTGIPASSLKEIIGRRLSRPVPAGKILHWEDLEEDD